MNPDLISILEMGSERAVADIAVKGIEEKPESFRDILDLCFLEEYPMSMRAARVAQLYCEKYPEAIYPFLDEVVEKTIKSEIGGVRRNFLKIFSEFIDLERVSEPGPLLNTCFDWLNNARITPAIRIHAMGVIYKFGLKEPALLHELKSTIEIVSEEGEISLKTCGRNMVRRIEAMTTPQSLYADLIAFCRANADEAIVQKYSRYFKEGYDAYGVTSTLMQEKLKSVMTDISPDLKTVLETSRLLIPGSKYEEPSFALMMVKALKKEYTTETFEEIGHWFSIGINNWAHTDALCSEILSVFLLKKIVDYKAMAGWRKSSNKFQRRAVPVSLIKLLKERDDYREFFAFIEPLMMDPAREVHQGVGWFLREAWKKQPGQTEEFLLKYKDTAPRLIFQYATEKMTPADKERFRKKKK